MSSIETFADTTKIAFHGNVLRSAFQPIYSFSHQRLIGHEALLRASDAGGHPVSPQAMFERCTTIAERRRLDQACCLLHARGFALGGDPAQWLFLNVDASAFSIDDPRSDTPAETLLGIARRAGLQPDQIVVELLEAALPDDERVERWTEEIKTAGFNVALDDFGAGHSNFDRVFRLRPHIVKLDRSVISRAATDNRVRRVMAQMISLLHECGTQVLVEGVENSEEATIALDSDADFVQGYHFGRPHAVLRRPHQRSHEMAEVWADCDERSRVEATGNATRVEPYGDALMEARRLLEAGLPIEDACGAFLRLESADLCYLLDDRGQQVAQAVFGQAAKKGPGLADKFAPLLDVRGARWSRRSYFRCALASPGKLQVTRPYPTMHGPLMTVTLSVCFTMNGVQVVLCGDKLWRSHADAATDPDRHDASRCLNAVAEPLNPAPTAPLVTRPTAPPVAHSNAPLNAPLSLESAYDCSMHQPCGTESLPTVSTA